MTLVWLLVLLAAIALSAIPLTSALGRRAGWPLGVLLLGAAGLLGTLGPAVVGGRDVTALIRWVPALGLDVRLRLDGLSLVFAVLALVIGAIVFFYSSSYLPDRRQLDFYLIMASFTFAMVFLVLSDDLILMFLCWELTSLASFLLIARAGHAGEDASMRTMLITFGGGLTLLVAVALTIHLTGTTNLTAALASPVWGAHPALTSLIAVLVAVSAFTKSAQFPFHIWLPDAMAAATPVSAYLHAAAVVKAGIYLLMRFTAAFHAVPVWNALLLVTGLVTTVLGGFFALQKWDLKKLMAYSTVSQLGLIVATIGIGTQFALAAAILHTIAHACFKSGLFMLVGVVDHQNGTRSMPRLPALARAMPWTFAVTAVGVASMAGVPPMLGFVSKENILGAMLDAGGPSWVPVLALTVTGVGAVLTFAYCGKILFGTFVDGPPPGPQVRESPAVTLVPAAIPIVVGLPLAFVVDLFDGPVAAAVAATHPGRAHSPSYALWHGVNLELVVTLVVLAVGATLVAFRARLRPRVEVDSLPFDGARLMSAAGRRTQRVGMYAADLVRADHLPRHVVPMVLTLSGLLLGGSAALWAAGWVAPAAAGLSSPLDALLLLVIAGATLALVRATSRIGATVLLGCVGIAMTLQLFLLGAPDVGLTQLLVEILTVLVIMLVLRKLPVDFTRPRRRPRATAGVVAVLGGLAAGVGTWTLTGRRGPSDLADHYLTQGPVVTGGNNIVNVILVEFRALDTFGELTVLGMAGIAIVAILARVPRRHLDPPADPSGESPAAYVPIPLVDVAPRGTRARRALDDAEANTEPLRLLQWVLVPVLALVSAVLLWRGHNEPGGGFIAALVAACAVSYIYLASATDRPISRPGLPVLLIAGGVLIALGTGLVGHLDAGFLTPLHGDIAGIHLSTSLVFDLGVYAAVLGLVMIAFNVLGAPAPTGTPADGSARGDAEVRP